MVIDWRTEGRPAVRKLPKLSRRGLLAGAAASVVLKGSLARAATPVRVAAVDWAMLETALALGVTPVAASELELFRKFAVEPAVPDTVADLGLRGALSYEQLIASRPDLVLISPWYENRRGVLARVAPVESFSIYEPRRPPLRPAEEATRALAARLGRSAEAETVIAAAAAGFEAARKTLAPLAGRPVLVINLGDGRHFRAFGADSMFGDVLARLGLSNAWTVATRFGAYPTVGVEALAGMGDAIVVNVGPTPPAALASVHESPLWRAMPPIEKGRFVDLAPVNPYGALPAARRFARLLAEALDPGRHG